MKQPSNPNSFQRFTGTINSGSYDADHEDHMELDMELSSMEEQHEQQDSNEVKLITSSNNNNNNNNNNSNNDNANSNDHNNNNNNSHHDDDNDDDDHNDDHSNSTHSRSNMNMHENNDDNNDDRRRKKEANTRSRSKSKSQSNSNSNIRTNSRTSLASSKSRSSRSRSRSSNNNNNNNSSTTSNIDSHLYEWIVTKDWNKAQEFLSSPDIHIDEKKLALQYQDLQLDLDLDLDLNLNLNQVDLNMDNNQQQGGQQQQQQRLQQEYIGTGDTPLIRAVIKQSIPLQIIKDMIIIGGIDIVKIQNASNWNALHWASYSNHVSIEVYELLLSSITSTTTNTSSGIRNNRNDNEYYHDVNVMGLGIIYAMNNYNHTPLDILLERQESYDEKKEKEFMESKLSLTSTTTTSTSMSTSKSIAKAKAKANLKSTYMDKVQALLRKEQQLLLTSSSTNNQHSTNMLQFISWTAKVSANQFQNTHIHEHHYYYTNPNNHPNNHPHPHQRRGTIIQQYPFIKSIVNSTFILPQYLFIAMADLYMQVMIVVVFSFFLRNAIDTTGRISSAGTGSSSSSAGGSSTLPSLIILLIGFMWFFLRKVTQFRTNFLKTFYLEPVNVLDLIHFVLLIGSIAIIIGTGSSSDSSDSSDSSSSTNAISTLDRVVFTSATCVSWLKLLFVIGNLYYSVAIFAVAVITIVGYIIPFLFTSTLLLLMISHMYLMWSAGQEGICNINNNDNDYNYESWWSCDLPSSYSETFATLFSLESQIQSPQLLQSSSSSSPSSSSSSHKSIILSYIHGFVIGIIMLNVLIAMISNFFMKALEKGEYAFWRNRLIFLTECQSLFSIISWSSSSSSSSSLLSSDLRDELENDISHHENEDNRSNDYSRVDIDIDQDIDIDIAMNEDHCSREGGGGGDAHSTFTEKSKFVSGGRLQRRRLNRRIAFGKDNWDVYKRKLRKEDKRLFFRWWFNQSSSTEDKPVIPTPSLRTRLKYFFGRASLEDILYPGKEFENIVIGIQYNEKGKGCRLLLARVASYLLSAINIFLLVMMFTLGTVTFGLLWHPQLKENLFYVEPPIYLSGQHMEKMDGLKDELLSNLEQYEMNQDKKIDKMMKTQGERGKKQLVKMSKKQKEFSKGQREQGLRLDKIDKHLAEIKSMMTEMAREKIQLQKMK